MVKFLQSVLIRIYALTRAAGFLNTPLGNWLFTSAYWAYKHLLEPSPMALARFVPPGAWVVDVGANLGFYSQLFAGWVAQGGRVLAVEPESANFRHLQTVAKRSGKLIDPLQSLLSEVDGELKLRINPASHADHRVTCNGEGLSVPSCRLDSAMEARGNPHVGLIKIDVQGAELRVLLGAQETLRRCRPALYMEVDDQALKEAGTSASELDAFLENAGYVAWVVESDKLRGPVASAERVAIRRRLGYADFLYLPSQPTPQRHLA